MSKSKEHTPGPWEVDDQDDVIKTLPDGSVYYIASIHLNVGATTANAHLIAAAPLLLAFVEDIASGDCACQMYADLGDPKTCYRCLAAHLIAQVKGGES